MKYWLYALWCGMVVMIVTVRLPMPWALVWFVGATIAFGLVAERALGWFLGRLRWIFSDE